MKPLFSQAELRQMDLSTKRGKRFTAKVKEQAAGEAGWTKIRDAIVIPFAVQIGLYIGKQILQTVQTQTAAA